MIKTVKSLLLALLNATLILAALCLFLFWKASAASRDVIGEFAGVQQIVTPLRDDLQTLTDEIRDMRATLAAALALPPEQRPEALDRLAQQVSDLDGRMAAAQNRLAQVQQMPGELMDRAVSTGVDRVMRHADGWRACTPAEAATAGD